jgi:peptide/nickel transport system permease protein
MTRFIIRRLLGAVLVLFVVSVITFGVFMWVPTVTGDPNVYARLYAGKVANESQVQEIAHKLGYDRPLYEQYLSYMGGIFIGREFSSGTQTAKCNAPCLGYSFPRHANVTDLIFKKFWVTFSVCIGAAVIWLVLGVSVGVISALKRGTIADRASMGFALAGVSLPTFFIGNVLLLIFSYTLGWIPNVHYVPFTENPYLWARNLILPWLTIALITAALYARLMRANMLETMSEDYIRTARAKGLSRRNVVVKHGMRAALTPIVTIFGLDLGLLLGGAIITETVFNLPGLGRLAFDAIAGKDLPVILGTTLFAAVFIVLANVVVDVLYSVVDPRVRLQ